MDVSDAQVVLETTDWIHVAPQVARLTAGSLLGKSMFAFAEVHIVGAQLARKVDELLGHVMVLDVISQEGNEKPKAEAAKLKQHALNLEVSLTRY